MQEAVAKTGRYDVMMPTAMSYPDWIDSGVIFDLTEWVEKYNPEIFDKEWGVVFLPVITRSFTTVASRLLNDVTRSLCSVGAITQDSCENEGLRR